MRDGLRRKARHGCRCRRGERPPVAVPAPWVGAAGLQRELASSPMSLRSSYWKTGQARKAAHDEKRWPPSERWSRARCTSRSGSCTRSWRSIAGASAAAAAAPIAAMATPTDSDSVVDGGGTALAAALATFGQPLTTTGGRACIRPGRAFAVRLGRSRCFLVDLFFVRRRRHNYVASCCSHDTTPWRLVRLSPSMPDPLPPWPSIRAWRHVAGWPPPAE